jgi:dual specificity phosphatase 12
MEQLRLYYSLGCPEDLESQPAYQRWVYKREVELSTAIGRAPDRLRFEDEEKKVVEASGVLTEGISELKPEEQKTLRCRKCRGILASSEYFEPHVPKEEAEVDPYAPISTSDTLPAPNPDAAPREAIGSDRCGHYFIQPLSWMRPALETGELEGRLNCPNARCGAAVGRFNWKGLKCSCGAWEIPAFAIQKGRVDVLGGARVLGDAGRRAAGVRLPPGMRMPPGRSENL